LRDQSGAGTAVEVFAHVLDVCPNGSCADSQGLCDFGPLETVGQQSQDFDFPRRQSASMVGRLVWQSAKRGDDLVAYRLAAQSEAAAAQADRAGFDRHLQAQSLAYTIFSAGEMFGAGYPAHQGPTGALAR
jgi:hypothetical protein